MRLKKITRDTIVVLSLFLFVFTGINGKSLLQARQADESVTLELFRIMKTAGSTETLDAPWLYHEPHYTRGDSNVIHYRVPTYPDGADSTSYTLTLLLGEEGILDSIVSVVELDSAILQSQTIYSLPYRPLKAGVEYRYTTALFVYDRSENRLYTSPYADTVRSVQDVSPPAVGSVKIPQENDSPVSGWVGSASPQVETGLTDPGGLWKATVYGRAEGGTSWTELMSQTAGGISGSHERLYPGDTTFSIQLEGLSDGKHEFKIGGTDATYTPESAAKPGFDLAGNIRIPRTGDEPDVTVVIDTRSPGSVGLRCEQVANEIELSWNSALDEGVGMEGYLILRSYEDPSGIERTDTLSSVAHTATDSLQYTDEITARQIVREYRYQIQPFDSLGHIQTTGGRDTCQFEPLPGITIRSEPEFTAGNSNTLFWEVEERGLFPSYRVLVMPEGASIPSDSIIVEDSGQELFEATFSGLHSCTQYRYWVESVDDFNRRTHSDTVESTQDFAPPEVHVDGDEDLLSTEQVSLNFSAWDLCSGSVDSAWLYLRHHPDSSWRLAANLDLDEEQPAGSEENAVESLFSVTTDRDGRYGIYIGAKDTVRTARNTHRTGNRSIPELGTHPQTVFFNDTRSPAARITELDSLRKALCLRISYSALDSLRDGFAGGLEQIRLYARYESDPEFRLYQTHEISDNARQVDSSFSFLADSGNGTYHFYTEAVDAAGNTQPDASRQIHTVEFDGTPELLGVVPGSGTYHHAATLDSLMLVFDREVRPSGNWNEVIRLTNHYRNGEDVEFTVPGESSGNDTLVIRSEDFHPTGYYTVEVDLARIENDVADCPTIPGQLVSSDFYTFMEAGEGGEILTPELELAVPEGEPRSDVVFRFRDTLGVSCEYEMFEALSDSAEVITARINVAGDTIAGIPGDLTLNYRTAPENIHEPTLRVFTRTEGHCIPANALQNYAPDVDRHTITVKTNDVTGLFFLLGQGAATTPDEQIVLWNYPNPFGTAQSSTNISYYLRYHNGSVRIRIYDQFGHLVKSFHGLESRTGLNTVIWDGRNDRGEQVANGGYICVLMAGGTKQIHKIAVMR